MVVGTCLGGKFYENQGKIQTFSADFGNSWHHRNCCFQAEEITLTIGQAFDLAYKRFLEKKGNQMEKEKQFMLLQQQVMDKTR